MQTITLPVSSLSRRILLREHGPEPIRLQRADPLLDLLRPDKSASANERDTPEGLDSEITLEVGSPLARALSRGDYRVSFAIHRRHVEQMMRFVWAQSFAQVEATKSLRMFYDLHGIDEDDFAESSAYRAWQRFRSEKDEVFERKPVTPPHPRVLRFGRGKRRPLGRPLVIETELDQVFQEARRLLLASQPRTPRYVLKQLHIYLYKEHGHRNIRALTRHFQRSARSVYRAVERIKGYMQTDQVFAACIEQAIGTLYVLPVAGKG